MNCRPAQVTSALAAGPGMPPTITITYIENMFLSSLMKQRNKNKRKQRKKGENIARIQTTRTKSDNRQDSVN